MSGELDNSHTVEITGKIMVIAIIILFLVVVFVFLLHLYAKWFLWSAAEPTPPPQPRRNRRRFVFNPGQDPVRRGLDISIVRSLPVVIFQSSEELKEGLLECAVCLSEITQGEKARLLPNCNHAFHVECIDMWFQSHSTCPLCRNSVAPQHEETFTDLHEINSNQSLEEILVSGYSSESPHFPTNVLFWGDQTQVSTAGAGAEGGGGGGHLEEGSYPQASSSSSSSTSGSGNGVREEEMVVIEIPLELSDYSEEESSKSPVPTQRLRSFKRLLSREKKVNVDV